MNVLTGFIVEFFFKWCPLNHRNVFNVEIVVAGLEKIEQIEEEEAEGDSDGLVGFLNLASKPRFKFDLSNVRVGPARAPTRPPVRQPFAVSGHPSFFAPRTLGAARAERKSVYMPLLPRH